MPEVLGPNDYAEAARKEEVMGERHVMGIAVSDWISFFKTPLGLTSILAIALCVGWGAYDYRERLRNVAECEERGGAYLCDEAMTYGSDGTTYRTVSGCRCEVTQ